jgi:hypothetical protein
MKYNMFHVPFFIDKIDLSRIDIGDAPYEKVWLSETPSTIGKNHEIPKSTFEYLIEIFTKNLGADLIGNNPRFGQIWRNKYEEHDWQDIHIHPRSSWSFVIYETVEKSNTVFMNPLFKDIQNQFGTNVKEFPLDFRPECEKGDIVIFPSFIEHFVRPGNIGTTISGNVYMDFE